MDFLLNKKTRKFLAQGVDKEKQTGEKNGLILCIWRGGIHF